MAAPPSLLMLDLVPTTLTQYQKQAFPLPPKGFFTMINKVYGKPTRQKAVYGWEWSHGRPIMAANNTNPILQRSRHLGMPFFSRGEYHSVSSEFVWSDTNRRIVWYLYGSSTAGSTLRLSSPEIRQNYFQKEHAAVTSRAINAQALLAPPWRLLGRAVFPIQVSTQTQIPAHLQQIISPRSCKPSPALLLDVAPRREATKFFRQHGGTRMTSEKTAQADLLARLSHAINYFDGVMGNLMVAICVSKSRCSQPLISAAPSRAMVMVLIMAGDQHHSIVGGAVKGGNIYGNFPVTGLKHAEDVGSGSLTTIFGRSI